MAQTSSQVYVETPLVHLHLGKQDKEADVEPETVRDATDFQFIVNEGEDSEMKCTTLRINITKLIFYYLFGIITGFGGFLLGYWYPTQRVLYTHEKCHPEDADAVVIKNREGIRCTCKMKKISIDKSHSAKDFSEQAKDELSEVQVYFVYQFLRYFWDPKGQAFVETGTFSSATETSELRDFMKGLSEDERISKLAQYGENYINVPIKSFLRIFVELTANPFYVFQIFSCILWIMQEYISLSIFILVVSFFGLLTSTYSTRKQLTTIKKMVAESRNVRIVKNSDNKSAAEYETIEINSKNLVPGDVIVVDDASQVLCDAILLTGNCIVDESLLTGESVPVHKHCPDKLDLNEFAMKNSQKLWANPLLRKHVLFNGSKVVKTLSTDNSEQVFALVLSTGFHSLKGRLLRAIIHATPLTFKFFRDSLKFIIVIGIIALCGFGYSVYVLHQQGVAPGDILIKGLDVITIAVSPVLPIALSTGIILAERQLKLFNIFCTDLQRINACGKIKLVCFDKTGTLTHNNLNLRLVQSCMDQKFNKATDTITEIDNEDVIRALASCHSLAFIDDEIVGDPMEKELLNFSLWKIVTNQKMLRYHVSLHTKPISVVSHKDDVNCRLYIWKQFIFESHLKRMSVLVSDDSLKSLYVYAKGSPEGIRLICDPRTVPDDFHDLLEMYTKRGNRVIALACKYYGQLEEFISERFKAISRQDAESNLTFCGFVILENSLKSATRSVINTLHDASVKTVMATGDHLFTAVSVALDCDLLSKILPVKELTISEDGSPSFKVIHKESTSAAVSNENAIDCQDETGNDITPLKELIPKVDDGINNCGNNEHQIVMTGDELERLRKVCSDLYSKILVYAKVFARMSPDQKANVVEDLMKIGYCVCMCGDGANDCNALKTANVGISLSEAEASVAAPFTSRIQDITCIPRLICEGRGALVTAFSCFKFIALYGIVQFMSVLILFSIGSTLSDYQYLLFDGIMAIGLVAFMIEARANPKLSKQRPLGRLFHPRVIFSVFLQIMVQLLFQLAAFFYVRCMSWYIEPDNYEVEDYDLYVKCCENTAVFAISSFQYIILALAFAEGEPFRQDCFLNVRFVCYTTALANFVMYLVLAPGRHLQELLLLVEIPDCIFSISLVLLAAGNALVSCMLEKFLINSRPVKRFLNALRGKSGPQNMYKKIMKDTDIDLNLIPSFTSTGTEDL